jgi:hypothetical protein
VIGPHRAFFDGEQGKGSRREQLPVPFGDGVDRRPPFDAHVQDFRTRPLVAGPDTFVAADALMMKVREGG